MVKPLSMIIAAVIMWHNEVLSVFKSSAVLSAPIKINYANNNVSIMNKRKDLID